LYPYQDLRLKIVVYKLSIRPQG